MKNLESLRVSTLKHQDLQKINGGLSTAGSIIPILEATVDFIRGAYDRFNKYR